MTRLWRGLLSYLTANGFEKLSRLFIAVILTNTVAIFHGYWWEETFTIVYWTIYTAFAIDLLIPYRLRFARLLLQIVAAVAVTMQFAEMDWIVARPESWRDWAWWLLAYAVQLDPFIWFSLGLLLLYTLFGLWTTKRTRMFGVIGASLLVLTVADSFTPIWLWDEVGMVVFIGLLWLVVSHMAKLRREHPSSWRELLEYPIQLVVPIALVLSVLMLVGLSVPSISPILQDPYTLWKESRGEKVQVFLGEKGIDPLAAGSSRNASSGYSRSDEMLGGGFDYDYSPMMTVTTSHRSYWRGETKNLYTGEGWSNAPVNDTSQRVVKGEDLPNGAEPPAGTLKVDQTVTMLREDVYPVLFAAAPVEKVNWLESEEAGFRSDLLWVPEVWELRLANWSMQRKRYPEAYSVTSSVTVLDEELLRKSEAGWSNAEDASLRSIYLQLPDTVPQRVRDLAEQITAEGTNDYDKAKLLEAYLSTNYAYNNKPDETKLTGGAIDFVDKFLFELMEGYCDYFSTSMAVMARSLGMPARWVKGFAPGVLPASAYGPPGDYYMEEEINPTGSGTYTVRNSDAHSWVEIYFDGFGWVPFEATAGFSFPYSFAEEEEAALPELDDSTEVVAAVEAEETSFNVKAAIWSTMAIVVLAAGVLLYYRRERIIASWHRLRHGSYTNNDQIVIETHRLLRLCKKRGLVREEHETLREAILRWSQSQKRLREDFRFVLNGFEQAKYGSVLATSEETERFVSKVRALIDELK